MLIVQICDGFSQTLSEGIAVKRNKAAFVLFLERLALVGGLTRVRRRRARGHGVTAREVLDQPPRPVRDSDGDAPSVPTPHW